ncbi:sensor histidine kinase [Clostridium sp. D33t1_170424_F3]|uniref:sensor histidine kinase n=1 Tax=Clostridium sp. D33t1_170424_F3 TaxID=2787099 RepID=UPI0018AAF73C|nr:sensor histidine kinase [Clostridium sp. D33t1_170424_F3]
MEIFCRWSNLYLEAFSLFWLLERNYKFRWDTPWLKSVKYLLALLSIGLFRLDPSTEYFSTPNFTLYFSVLAVGGLLFCLLLCGNLACKGLTAIVLINVLIEIHLFIGTQLYSNLPSHSQLIYLLLTKGMLAVVLFLMVRFPIHAEYTLPRNYYFLMFLAIVVTLTIRFTTLFLRLDALNNLWLLVLYLALYCTYSKLLQDYGRKVYFELANNQLSMQINSWKDIETMYRELRELRHDLKNHMLYMQALLDQRDYEALSAYFSQLNDPRLLLKQVMQTGCPVLDAVLNTKSAQCSMKGIPVDMKVLLSQKVELPAEDLCAILCNLIDNAVEASEHLPVKDIRVEVKAAKGCLWIKVSNRYPCDPREKNPELATTKENPEQHGIGIQIVRDLAKKHEGQFRFTFEDGHVIAGVTLPMGASDASVLAS